MLPPRCLFGYARGRESVKVRPATPLILVTQTGGTPFNDAAPAVFPEFVILSQRHRARIKRRTAIE
jgi:hypothetical protein